ncbi:MAG: DUF4317 domain-containing protein [Lachnospiraceae bacterium]|nr:DUF4317 domain-containing protein [Lachnospiraceae bacterium]
MNKKDVMELKKRFKKEACSIDRLAGCYVDAGKNKAIKFNESFLNMDDEEFYKYLEIAKKTLTGTLGNNILELDFPLEEEATGGKQHFLYALRNDGLCSEDLLDRLYDLIIDGYNYVGNYLILVFHDTYDIITKTSDNMKLDESEEVYEYLLVSICPVVLSKAGLGVREDENRIGARIRDWVVGVPDLGFLFPAFDNRSADIHKVDYFIRDAKDSHSEVISDVLGCAPRMTATEQRNTFSAIVKRAFSNDTENGKEALINIQESFNALINTGEELTENEINSIILTPETIDEILVENNIEGEKARVIKEVTLDEFMEELPLVSNLIDNKALAANEREREKKELVKEVASLKNKVSELEEATSSSESGDVSIFVYPERAEKIHTEIIDDKKYILIPVDDNSTVKVNGVDKDL